MGCVSRIFTHAEAEDALPQTKGWRNEREEKINIRNFSFFFPTASLMLGPPSRALQTYRSKVLAAAESAVLAAAGLASEAAEAAGRGCPLDPIRGRRLVAALFAGTLEAAAAGGRESLFSDDPGQVRWGWPGPLGVARSVRGGPGHFGGRTNRRVAIVSTPPALAPVVTQNCPLRIPLGPARLYRCSLGGT